MLELALGFFIALIVLLSFAGIVFLNPLTFRATVSQGHQPLAVDKQEEEEEETEIVVKKDRKEKEEQAFETVEVAHIVVKKCKDLRLRSEAMARVQGAAQMHTPHTPPALPPRAPDNHAAPSRMPTTAITNAPPPPSWSRQAA